MCVVWLLKSSTVNTKWFKKLHMNIGTFGPYTSSIQTKHNFYVLKKDSFNFHSLEMIFNMEYSVDNCCCWQYKIRHIKGIPGTKNCYRIYRGSTPQTDLHEVYKAKDVIHRQEISSSHQQLCFVVWFC